MLVVMATRKGLLKPLVLRFRVRHGAAQLRGWQLPGHPDKMVDRERCTLLVHINFNTDSDCWLCTYLHMCTCK